MEGTFRPTQDHIALVTFPFAAGTEILEGNCIGGLPEPGTASGGSGLSQYHKPEPGWQDLLAAHTHTHTGARPRSLQSVQWAAHLGRAPGGPLGRKKAWCPEKGWERQKEVVWGGSLLGAVLKFLGLVEGGGESLEYRAWHEVGVAYFW